MNINKTNMMGIVNRYNIKKEMSTREIADLIWDEYTANALLYATYIKFFLSE